MVNESIWSRRLCAEAFGTFCLVFAGTGAVVVNEVTGGGVSHVGVALTFGLVVIAFEALFAGPISGASMNPARSLAPAVVAMQLDSLWIYLIAPILGSLTAVAVCRCLQPGPGNAEPGA